jgi:hypothetical protein
MKTGALLALVLALAACATSVTLQPTPSIPAGPAIPNGAHAVDVTFLGRGPAGCGPPPSIVAGASLIEAKFPVIEACGAQCLTPGLACWAELPNEPGQLYFIVLTANECTRPVRELAAVDGSTLYFIHWIGKPTGVCNAMMAAPAYRLYSADKSLLPGSGNVTVELQVQDVVNGTSDYDAEVSLG